MWQAWVNFILGLWLLISGFIPGLNVNINYIIVGILIAILGFWTYKQWQGIVNGILGLWILVSGFIAALMVNWNLIIVGIVVAILGIWQALTKPKAAE